MAELFRNANHPRIPFQPPATMQRSDPNPNLIKKLESLKLIKLALETEFTMLAVAEEDTKIKLASLYKEWMKIDVPNPLMYDEKRGYYHM